MSGWRIARDAMVCPTCRATLDDDGDGLSCAGCEVRFPVVGDAVLFRKLDSEEESSYLEGARGALRRSRWYPWIFRLLAPVLVTGPNPGKRYADVAESGVVVDLGAGNDRRHARFVNVDLLPYPCVDLVCDAEQLPFADDSLDAVVCVVVLEHVPRMRAVVAEVVRALKPGGRFFVAIPFLQPFHAAPHDYRRWTLPGLTEDLTPLCVTDSGVYGGPASAFAWMLAECLALLLSLGSRRVRGWLSLPLQALLSPIKWLDLIAIHHRDASRLASALWIEAEKR